MNRSAPSSSDTSSSPARETTAGSEASDPAAFYRDTVLQHSVEPVGFQAEIGPTHSAEQYNPLCGDRVTVMFRIDGPDIQEAAFDGEACAICLASASLLCAKAPGKSPDELHRTGDWLAAVLRGEDREEGDVDLRALSGVRRYPSRVRCALLPWEAAEKALAGESADPSPRDSENT